MYHVAELALQGNEFTPYKVEAGDWLGELARINLFVGANNCGKSRFLRALAAMKPIKFKPALELREFNELVTTELPRRITEALTLYNAGEADDFLARAKSLHRELWIVEEAASFEAVKKLYQDMNAGGNLWVMKGGTKHHGDHPNLWKLLRHIVADHQQEVARAQKLAKEKYAFRRIYIPTLRGLRRFGPNDEYLERTKQDYFPKAAHVDVFTGLSLYDELSKLLLGTYQERQIAADFERFLSESFFEGVKCTLIPKHGQNVIDVKIGDERQLPIYSLGDGIQSIIILTFPLFRYRNDDLLVFIEEPELFLHPGMQRILLNALRRPDFPTAQYFMATHSNHLLDLTLEIEDISVFTFTKQLEDGEHPERSAQITIQNVSNDDERSLQLLGILNSSVFLANCTIWVEGITDRRYLSHYLDLYQKSLVEEATENGEPTPKTYKQDLHYSFVEYAGSNITHYSVLEEDDSIVVERLCGKLFLITDRDNEKSPTKARRHRVLSSKLGTRYYRLNCREIENLLTPVVIAGVIKDFEGDDAQLKPFNRSNYRTARLGKFIDEKVVQKARRTYSGDGGTIANKVLFCQKALSHIEKFEDISTEAQELTKLLFEFIAQQNTN